MLKLEDLINKRILIYIEDDKINYVSAIQEVTKDYIAIAIPVFQRIPLALREKEYVNIKLVGDGEFYILRHKVIGKKKDTIPLYLLSLPESIERVQQRNFVRIPTVLNVEYKEKVEDEPQRGKTLDISGGGMKIAVKGPMETGKVIHISFKLPNYEPTITANAKVIRNEVIEVQGGKLNCIGVSFLDIEENCRNQIISFIFSKMAEQRRVNKKA